jgi:protein-disulfide isomerase
MQGFPKVRLTIPMIMLSIALAMPALSAQLPEKGSVLPSIRFLSPPLPEDQKYLAVAGDTFSVKDVTCQVLLVEIINVYCPACYRQAPLFNKLFARIEQGKLKNKVKMLAVAAGGTAAEVKYLRKDGQYAYPIVQDQTFTVHRLLGEPRTPFTILVDKKGHVLYAHLGIIEDIDAFYDSLKQLVE